MKFEECKPGTRVRLEGIITSCNHSVLVSALDGQSYYLFPDDLIPCRTRPYKKGDTVRIVGVSDRLFSRACTDIRLEDGKGLGCEVVIEGDEDSDRDVFLPSGVLEYGVNYINAACIELVEAVEDKPQKPHWEVTREGLAYFVRDDEGDIAAMFRFMDGFIDEEFAKARADELCDKLNAEESNMEETND